ncbi:Flagellar biosynthesis protein FlhF [Candidatus Arthromitus sp. SFB-1]|nr:Flagellar biosynthesis protein FlhF [Candidatus Arthromitus sp. SFB-1]
MFVQSIQSDEVTLVVSAGMKQQDLNGFINSFKGIKFKNVIVTKLDETNSFGMFVNICYKTSLPISFVTVGQDVPLDIKQADKEEILNMILGE